jgi:putative transposase
MTYQQSDFTLPAALLEQIAEQGFDALPELIRIVINEAMRLERQQYLGVAPYQRSPERRGHGNGFKEHTERTRLGEITFAVPQVREGGFLPHTLEKGLRSEQALTLSLAERYVQGVSTRKVTAIVEQLCGSAVSSSQVSRAAGLLDEKLEAWRTRRLGELVYLYLDARYEKVRQDGQVRDAAILIATGVGPTGHRQVLGVSVALSEQEVHWRSFLQSLVTRGLCGLRLIISDDHAGLKAARQAVFGGVPWQRCQYHLQQNAQAYVPRKDMQAEVASDIRLILNAPDRTTANAYLARIVQKYAKSAAKLADWLEKSRRPDRLWLPDHAPAPAAYQQQSGAGQPRARPPHYGRQHLPERGFLPTSGQRGPDRTGRRMAGRPRLSRVRECRHAVVVEAVDKWATGITAPVAHLSTARLALAP